jgi:uncharacterized membrane protein
MAFLIFFIHHVAVSIQSSSIIASAARQTLRTIESLYPEQMREGEDPSESEMDKSLPHSTWQPVPSQHLGYIATVATASLINIAHEEGVTLRMACGPGNFIIQGAPLLFISLSQPPDSSTIHRLNACFTVSRERSIEQDAAFGIRQIVDVALKALSPGVNDMTTAIVCLDYLSAILASLGNRRIGPRHLYENGALRVVAAGPTFEDFADLTLDQIRQDARCDPNVVLRMLTAIESASHATPSEARRAVLRRHVRHIAETVNENVNSGYDRERVEERIGQVSGSLAATEAFGENERRFRNPSGGP